MKKLFLILHSTFCILNYSNAQPTIQWQKSLGGNGNDGALTIEQTLDSGYIMVGFTTSNNGDVSGNHDVTGNLFDCWVVKLNINGNIQWQKCLGGSTSDYATAIQQTTDTGFIIAGITDSNDGDVNGNHGSSDYWIVKLDPVGNIQWQKCLGGTFTDEAYSIQQTSDGGYIIAGNTSSNDGDVTMNHGGTDYWLVKLDDFGNIIWQKSFGGTGNDKAYCVMQTSDGGYITGGRTESNDGDVTGNHSSALDAWIIKLDAGGNMQWQKCLGGTNYDYCYSLLQISNGSYIMGGITGSNDGDVIGNHGGADFWIVELDGAGNFQWQKCYGGNAFDDLDGLAQTNDGGYILSGEAQSNDGDVSGNHGNVDYWIVKIDSAGNLQWQRCLGGSVGDAEDVVKQTYDGGFATAGFSASNDGDVTGNHGGNDFWVVKLGADTPTVIAKNNLLSSINLFPNPATSELTIDNGELKIKEVEIYNVLGEKRLTPTLSKGEGVRVDVSSLPAGVYFVAVKDDKGNKITRRFVKI